MLVKDQLRIRMEQLSMPVSDLAKRLNVSSQTVRHWLNGRSFPGKSKAPELESALSFKLDYSEGASPRVGTVEASLHKSDVETFLLISRLPPEIRAIFGKLARAFERYIQEPERAQSHAEPDAYPDDSTAVESRPRNRRSASTR